MDLARTIEYAVQGGWSLIVSFIWLFPLTGLGTTESDIDCRVIGVVTITSAFVSAASELAAAIFGLRGARVICYIFATGQPTIFSRTEAGHECCEGCHGFWLFLAEVAASHSSRMLCLKAARASASGQSTIWFFLVRNLVQNFLADSPGRWTM